MIKEKHITKKYEKAVTVLCNSCVHLKKHLEHKKVLCAKSCVKVIRVNHCQYFQRKVIQSKRVDMLGWCD